MKRVLLALLLLSPACGKKVDVQAPGGVKVSTNDRILAVLNSDLPADEKVRVIHDILDREQNRGQNLMNGWRETLAWLGTVVTLAVKR